jgi:hypothetical protein
MKAIIPITVSGAVLAATNVPEDDAAEYNAVTTYADQARVIIAAQKSVYESLQGSNTGNDPTATGSLFWIRVMATKPNRPFDRILSAPVSKTGDITYSIAPTTLIRAVALIGVSAAEATIAVENSGGTVINTQTKTLIDFEEIIDPLTMVTIEPGFQETAIFEDVNCQPGNTVEVTIGNGSGTSQISEIVMGDTITIGTAVFGSGIGIDDYSDFNEDAFGNVSIVKKAFRDKTNFDVSVVTEDIRRIRRKLSSLRAEFSVYYMTTGEQDFGTTVYGRYDKLELLISGPSLSDMELRILGATYNDL